MGTNLAGKANDLTFLSDWKRCIMHPVFLFHVRSNFVQFTKMNKDYKIHAFYVIGILLTIIIVLVTARFGNVTELVGLINFAATLTSLVLAILAIVYAFLSNSSVSQNMNKISAASEEIFAAAREASQAASELRSKVEILPDRLEKIDFRLEEFKSLVKLGDSPDAIPLTKVEKEATLEIVDSFVSKISIVGWIGIYASVLAFTKKKQFSVFDSFSISRDSAAYIYAVLATMHSAGFLQLTFEGTLIKVVNVNEKIVDAVENHFEENLHVKFQKSTLKLSPILFHMERIHLVRILKKLENILRV